MEPDAHSLRYVVLRHEGIAEPHFDLMMELEPGALLTTWRSDIWPLAHQTRLTPLKDHRRDFLTFEGDLSANRGHVRRIETGTVLPLHSGMTMMVVRFERPSGPEEWLIANFPDHSVAFAPNADSGAKS